MISSKDNNEEALIKKSQQADIDLAGQFVVENMSNLGYTPSSAYSDVEALADYQSQYEHFCLMAKSNLAMDSVNPIMMTNPFIPALKQYIRRYIEDDKNKEVQAMKILYDGDELKYIIHQLSMLAFHANIKRASDINHLTKSEQFALVNPEQVALSLGLYVYFVLLVNNHFVYRDFNKLFVEAWFIYYETLPARLLMFQKRGDLWKDDFKGVLLAD